MKLAAVYVHCLQTCFIRVSLGAHFYRRPEASFITITQQPHLASSPDQPTPSYHYPVRRSGVHFSLVSLSPTLPYRIVSSHDILSPATIGTSLKSTPNPWLNSLPFLLAATNPLTLLVPACHQTRLHARGRNRSLHYTGQTADWDPHVDDRGAGVSFRPETPH